LQTQIYLPSKRTALGSACAAAALLAAFWSNQRYDNIESSLPTPENYKCKPHAYTTEIVSLDPLLIYINDFLSSEEANLLVALGYVSHSVPPKFTFICRYSIAKTKVIATRTN